MGATASHQPLDRHVTSNGSAFKRSASCRHSKSKSGRGSPRRMERLRRSFRDSFRRRKEAHLPESSKPHQWQADEAAVRAAICAFHVKYLGCVEVFESRGMQVCEDALRVLRNSRRRPVKAILHVSGDGLRVVDDETKGLMVDQTIEKVSFCAPDRNHDKGFSYICRDGTTRRWMCHGFLALRESGERLSHAVGCAFAVCLEKKQRRDKECGVTMNFDSTNSTFTRQGSFRQPTLTDRLQDTTNVTTPVNSINAITEKNILKESNKQVSEILPTSKPITPAPTTNSGVTVPTSTHNPHAIERPHATPSMLQRQGSFRGFSHLNQASPFKRQLSLRITDLPSNLERTRNLQNMSEPKTPAPLIHLKTPVSPIPESSPQNDSVSAMCQQLSFGLSLLTNKDDLFSLNNNNNQKTTSNNITDDFFLNSSIATSVANSTTTSVLPEAPKTGPISGSEAFLAKVEAMKLEKMLKNINSTSTPIRNSNEPSSLIVTSSQDLGINVSPVTSRVALPTPPATPPLPIRELPRPEQWLGKVAAVTLNNSGHQTSFEMSAPGMPGKKAPLLHLRAHSLGSAESFYSGRPQSNDPFNAEWVDVSQNISSQHPFPVRNTNPFLTSPTSNTNSVKVFEAHL